MLAAFQSIVQDNQEKPVNCHIFVLMTQRAPLLSSPLPSHFDPAASQKTVKILQVQPSFLFYSTLHSASENPE